MPSERRPGRWPRLLRLLLAGAVLVAGAACQSGRARRPEVATTTPHGPMVERYLTDALNLIQQHAFYADRVDWPAVRAEAGRRTADATTTAGTYDTIRWVLTKLGDRHSRLLTPEQASERKASGTAGRSFGMLALFPERVVVDVEPGGGAERAGVRVGDIVLAVDGRPPQGKDILDLPTPQTGGGPARVRLDLRRGHDTVHLTVEAADLPAVRPPTARRLSAPVNLLELFAVVGTTGDPESSRYVRAAYDAIRGVSTATTCGWVVDLRRNTGGSLPPMLQAVAPILGDGEAVGYRDRNGSTQWFAIENATLAGMGPAATRARPLRLRRPQPPVAVLTSRLTGSSGEGVIMAFRGRPDSRSFGEPTAGIPTGNAAYPLSDRAELHLTEGIGVDRTGATHQARIQPDRPVATDWTRYGTPADPVLQAATRWLEGRCVRG